MNINISKYKSNAVFNCEKSDLSLLPGRGGQGDEQGLQNAPDVNDGALLSDEEVHGRKDE